MWVVDSGGPKEAQVQSYSLGGANVPSWEGTLALMAGQIGATGRIRLNRPSAAAMRPYVRYLRTKWHLDPFSRLATIHQRYTQDRTVRQDRKTTVW